MITNQFLYVTNEKLSHKLSLIDKERKSLVQIFTNALKPTEALNLAKNIQLLCPNAIIIGSSVSGVIYQGIQYDNETLIVIEQYQDTEIDAHMIDMDDKSYQDISIEMNQILGSNHPSLMRLFVGNYYDYAHQLMETMNVLRPDLKIVGGMSGELHLYKEVKPFVFNAEKVLTHGLVFNTVNNSSLHIYGRVNTAHEAIGQVYTITETRERSILSIENTPANEWLQHNFGVLSTKEYKTWEEIAQNDPLVRLQLALVDHQRAIRFIHYDETNREISQYFSRLNTGTKFRISYTSPSKCAKESAETCREVANTPIEHLFCYSCLFRKLYLKNCAKWELSPFHENPVNGVFLLGEFGYSEEGNTLLNGSCVLSGMAETENYLSVDMSRLMALEDIRDEDEKLMNFITRKQNEPRNSIAHQKILEQMIAHESNHLTSPFKGFDVGPIIGDLSSFDEEKNNLHFNKICMAKVENADVLIGQNGQLGYFSQMKYILEQLKLVEYDKEMTRNIHYYSINSDTFVIACNKAVDRYHFLNYIHKLQERCNHIQKNTYGIPFLLRFVLIRNHPFMLERAYAMVDKSRNSQHHVIIDEHYDRGDLTPIDEAVVDELSRIKLIQYALDHDAVIPYYQGLYNNKTGKIDKYEALMRLKDEKGKVYTPFHFMEISKKYRLYLDLNLKMFQRVLRDFSDIDCGVSINLSVHDILSPDFYSEMVEALNSFHKPSNLTFELLEDECIANLDGIKDFISEVRSYGVKIAIDDFGSGYSNLMEIMKIRPDYIKIDGQIIGNINKETENESILEAVSLLGKRLSIDLVAEFVENAAIQERIVAHNIYYSQGYYFSKPKPFEEVKNEFYQDIHVDESIDEMKNHTEDHSSLLGNNDERNFFRAIQALSADLLFSLNLKTKQMRHFGMMQEKLGIPKIVENFPQSAFENHMVAEEDIQNVLETIRLMRQGVEQPGFFRIYNKERMTNWYRMDYKLVLNERGIPIEAIGKLTNIQQQKDMENKMNIDALTGCLRKSAFESLASDYIHKNMSSKGTLFIVDIDNFKSVNDNLGHQFGDRVLRGIGDKLRALFSDADLVGRVGGDEFMALMVGVNHESTVKAKAAEILHTLDATYKGLTSTYHVTASVGAATFPNHGKDFQSLYDHADIAMFDAKNRGKNGFVVYHENLSKGTMENTLPYEVATRSLAQHFDAKIVNETFNLLFETKEFEISLGAVLELIGKRFNVSRAYIFEHNIARMNTLKNTYEWCNRGVSSEIENLKEVPLSLIQDFYEQANAEGILYCNDLSILKKEDSRILMKKQGIKSFLHTYTLLEDRISYVFGVDECDTARIWTPIEVSTIMQVSKIIAQFLNHKKQATDLEKIASERLAVLNSLNYCAYIVDRTTYELTFFNKYIKKRLPSIAIGKKCYEVIRKKDYPCRDCPLTIMKEKKTNEIKTILYDSVLCQRMLVNAMMQPSFAGRECACITAISLDENE